MPSEISSKARLSPNPFPRQPRIAQLDGSGRNDGANVSLTVPLCSPPHPMRPLPTAVRWHSRAYATGPQSRLGPTLTLEHVSACQSLAGKKSPNSPNSSSNEHASSPFTGPSSAAHAESQTQPLVPRRGSSRGTSLSATEASQTLCVPAAYLGLRIVYSHTGAQFRATSGTCSRSARRSGRAWRGTLTDYKTKTNSNRPI